MCKLLAANSSYHVHHLCSKAKTGKVAIATAAKAKLLLQELKTLKVDLAFAKDRSSQLEEENKMLHEALEQGEYPTDDDMIRLQLESLLAEKARLANENSIYARENLFLREIVRKGEQLWTRKLKVVVETLKKNVIGDKIDPKLVLNLDSGLLALLMHSLLNKIVAKKNEKKVVDQDKEKRRKRTKKRMSNLSVEFHF